MGNRNKANKTSMAALLELNLGAEGSHGQRGDWVALLKKKPGFCSFVVWVKVWQLPKSQEINDGSRRTSL